MSVARVLEVGINKMVSPNMVRIISKAFRVCNERLHFYRYFPLNGMRYSPHDLEGLDYRYRMMHEMHGKAHTGLIQEMSERQFTTVLEVACGTGWNIPRFQNNGLDISETAIAFAMMKYPEHRYFNLGICDGTMIGDDSFDIVYSSSMLEHIGYYEEAMREMIRLAKREVWILFFEGLSSDEEHKIDFHPYPESAINGMDKDIFGRKVVLQNHIHETRKGWYWNRYSKKKVLEYSNSIASKVEVLDRTNRPFLDKESVLIMHK